MTCAITYYTIISQWRLLDLRNLSMYNNSGKLFLLDNIEYYKSTKRQRKMAKNELIDGNEPPLKLNFT